MRRRRYRYFSRDIKLTIQAVLLASGFVLFAAAANGSLWAWLILSVLGMVLVTALVRMAAKSMAIYYIGQGLKRLRMWNLHRKHRHPTEFGAPEIGEMVYSLCELHPRTLVPEAIKPGYSENWSSRWKTHKTSSSRKIIVLSVGPGTYDYEQHVLRITKRHWTGGTGTEWRWAVDEVWDVIEQMPGANLKLIKELRERQLQAHAVAA